MARLLLLLFSFFISFSSYSQNVDKVSKKRCVGYSSGVPIFHSDASDISECLAYSHLSLPNYDYCETEPSVRNGVISCSYRSTFLTLVEIKSYIGCPDGYVENDIGTCSPDSTKPNPDPHQCPDAGTFLSKTWGREGLNGWSTCRFDNCVVAIQVETHSSMPSGVCYVNEEGRRICRYDLFYTGQPCTYNPDGPDGVNPPDHEYPTDPVQPPTNPGNPPPSPDLPDEGGDVTPPIYDPDADNDGKPQDPVTKPNPDPQPDPENPDLSDGDNAIVGELSEANQYLENIDHTIEDLTNTTKSDNDALIEYQSHLLGEMKKMNKQLADGVGGGGNGDGNGDGDGSCEGEDCNPVGFPGAPEVVDPFAEILDETDINDILTRTEEVKTQLQTQMNNFKGLFRVPNYGIGGDIAPVEFSLKHAGSTIPVKFGIFSQISTDISSIIIMIAAFIAFLIVTTRR
ncbi:TPA: hypothetical protein NKV57_001080 [Vibrio parahaemolyticus]|nr:hypothetical protein [Vibrio parahaemolyticus]HCH4043592.1 hypothetical protein [Vibrio parahaemolyticus]HCH4823313.1 hypothetical protein [Vibrio parahaemolyticus]HCH5839178.1 hypothetical protein [Vibrio parahaemolyticus]